MIAKLPCGSHGPGLRPNNRAITKPNQTRWQPAAASPFGMVSTHDYREMMGRAPRGCTRYTRVRLRLRVLGRVVQVAQAE